MTLKLGHRCHPGVQGGDYLKPKFFSKKLKVAQDP
jgi:hypothetical protein